MFALSMLLRASPSRSHNDTCSRLHRLLNNPQQFPCQLVQLHLVAHRLPEGGQRLLCVILATVEAPVDELLNALTQGIEQGSDPEKMSRSTIATPVTKEYQL